MLLDTGRLRVNVIDEGTGRPVLWLHGLGGTWRDVEPQLDHLADHYRCIVPELRGHGRTPAVAGRFDTRALADDAVAVLDSLGVDAAVVVGLSLGGLVAQVLAVEHPDRVEALVLVDTGAKVPAPVGPLLRAAAGRIRAKGMEAALAMLGQLGHGAGGDPAAQRAARAAGTASAQRDLASNDPEVLAAGLVALADHDVRRGLRRLAVPTLVVVGEHDPVVPRLLVDQLVQAIPGARLSVVADGGHLPNRDCPEVFDAVVSSFIDGLPASAGASAETG
jgi:pimeloyl-ACP methyl ester carboxylesterase